MGLQILERNSRRLRPAASDYHVLNRVHGGHFVRERDLVEVRRNVGLHKEGARPGRLRQRRDFYRPILRDGADRQHAGLEACEQRQCRVDAGSHLEDCPVTGLQADLTQAGGDPAASVVQLCESDAKVFADVRHSMRMTFCHLGKRLSDGSALPRAGLQIAQCLLGRRVDHAFQLEARTGFDTAHLMVPGSHVASGGKKKTATSTMKLMTT